METNKSGFAAECHVPHAWHLGNILISNFIVWYIMNFLYYLYSVIAAGDFNI